ncbi:hypothetical protein [Caulobacter sp. S45]|uniref:hypothetical protein n=1 Tax=Caulobacter sp. S45 TaxID=1641861 RepID=UPI001576126C|nr:hypothetical protein [Caulobacter sp. S45]
MAMADEADRLASIVSYGRDKVRLKEQAQSWREQAVALETAPALSSAEHEPRGMIGWLRRRRTGRRARLGPAPA